MLNLFGHSPAVLPGHSSPGCQANSCPKCCKTASGGGFIWIIIAVVVILLLTNKNNSCFF